MKKNLLLILLVMTACGLMLLIGCSTEDPLEPEGPTTWIRTYDKHFYDIPWSVCEDPQGNIGLTGQTLYFVIDSSVTPYDTSQEGGTLIMKLGPTGDTLWYSVLGEPESQVGYHILPAYGGGYVVLGYTRNYGAGGADMYFAKISSSGELEWHRTYGGTSSDYGEHMQKTSDGGYILVGRTSSMGAGSYDMFVVKVNAFGTTDWTRTFGTLDSERADWVEVLSNGDYLIGGRADRGALDNQIYLVRINSVGGAKWQTMIGTAESEDLAGVVELDDKSLLVAGESSLPGGSNLYVARLDSMSAVLWQKTINLSGDQFLGSLVQTPDGAIVLCGGMEAVGDTLQKGYLTKIDINGNQVWDRLFGTSDDNEYVLIGITNHSGGGLLVSGAKVNQAQQKIKAYLIKTDANGLVH